MNKLRISFDFDNTLEYKEVQLVAKELIKLGHDVCILTTRYKDPSKYHFKTTHDELFKIAADCQITEINFTDFKWKYEVIDSLNIDIHIDDNYEDEVRFINFEDCKAKAICYSYGWVEALYIAIAELERAKNDDQLRTGLELSS